MPARSARYQVPIPDLSFELDLLKSGARHIAGVDEAGRDPGRDRCTRPRYCLTGRYCSIPDSLAGVRDSKLLSPKRRDEAFNRIMQAAVAVGVSSVEARLVDRLGVVEATRQAMLQALDSLPIHPDAVIVDSVRLPPESEYHGIHHSFNHADRTCLTVAAASICAKVSRDRDMIRRSARYPGYGFETNMGYGTPRHRAALERLGLCAIHRTSFRPMRESLLCVEKVASVV